MYPKEHRDEQLKKMRQLTDAFYWAAFKINCHPFLEFCGLMVKYIDVCQRSSDAGVDFNETSKHSGERLLAEGHDIQYLAEKFDCIFGASLADPKAREIFFREMGWDHGSKAEGRSYAEADQPRPRTRGKSRSRGVRQGGDDGTRTPLP